MALVRTLVAGHVCIDLMPRHERPAELLPGRLFDVGPLTLRPGGCVANTGLDLAALGGDVRLAADVGDDELGRLLRSLLRTQGVDATGIRPLPGCNTSYSIVVQPPGADRTFWHHVGANAHFDGRHLDLTGIDVLHLGYPTLLPCLYEQGGRQLAALLDRARARGITTSVDLATVDPSSQAARHDWEALLRAALPLVDVFAPSVDDLASALGAARSAAQWADDLVAAGAAVVMVKAGAAGLYLRTAGRERMERAGPLLARAAEQWCDRALHAPARAVEVVSTNGAGDAAAAGLLYGITAGMSPSDALDVAADAAAARVGGLDRLPPFEELSVTTG
ncbi:MAG TPA: PfkB family carbohydrate kinase [Acidimicrobiales bacterium]|nr:PfkB family carbohydrate kinase [Acidimicrobiales bacterium]